MSALPVNNSKELCRLSTLRGTMKSFVDFQRHRLLPCNSRRWMPFGCHAQWHVRGRWSDMLAIAVGGGLRRRRFPVSKLPDNLYTLQNNAVLMLC